MDNTIICAGCNKPLPSAVLAKRHYTQEQLRADRNFFCDRGCRVAYDKRIGHFQNMAASRGDGWRSALIVSNQRNPRRGKKKRGETV